VAPPSPALADRALLEAVGPGAHLADMARHLGESQDSLAPRLLDLELAGLLRADPGLFWRPV
jgi:DNA processing protein